MNTNATSLSDALLQAMESFADKASKSTKGTLTIEARVVEIIDKGKGIYKVWYQGSTFEATAANTEITYNIDDIVFVLVPDGDFDKNKIILVPVVTKVSNYVKDQEVTSYIQYGQNMIKDFKVDPIEMPAVAGGIKYYDALNIPSNERYVEKYHKLRILNERNTDIFSLGCNIKTEIPELRRFQGDYGITWPANVTSEGNKTVVFNRLNILGDVYNLSVTTPQNMYINKTQLPLTLMQTEEGRPVSTVKAFSSSFPKHEEGEIIGYDEDDNPIYKDEIFIKNLGLYPVYPLKEEEKTGYFLFLDVEDGYIFEDNNKRKIIPKLFLNGKQTEIDGFDCYWFKENHNIYLESTKEGDVVEGIESNNKYNEFGGNGWELLNDSNDVTLSDGAAKEVQYILNNYELEVDCPYFSTEYKCVLVKNNKVATFQIVNVYNIEKAYNQLILETSTQDGKYCAAEGFAKIRLTYFEPGVTDIEGVIPALQYFFQSSIQDEDKFNAIQISEVEQVDYIYTEYIGFEVIQKQSKAITVDFKVTLPDQGKIDKIKCLIYLDSKLENGIYSSVGLIGSTYVNIETRITNNYSIKIEGNNKTYKYDSYGNSPFLANYDGGITDISSFKEKEKAIVYIYNVDNGETQIKWDADHTDLLSCVFKVPVESLIDIEASYEPKNYKIEDGYYIIKDSYDSEEDIFCLKYYIKDTYREGMENTNILVDVYINDNSDIAPIFIENTLHLTFVKDNESKINGEKYTAIITPYRVDQTGKSVYMSDLKIIGIENEGDEEGNGKLYWLSPDGSELLDFGKNEVQGHCDFPDGGPFFDVILYCNGEIKNFSSLDDNWLSFVNNTSYDLSSLSLNFPGYILTSDDGRYGLYSEDDYYNLSQLQGGMLQAKILVPDTGEWDSELGMYINQECVYAYLPLKFYQFNNRQMALEASVLKPSNLLQGGFNKVVCATDGTHPKFENTPLYLLQDKEHSYYTYDELIASFFNITNTCSSNLRIENQNENEIKVRPITNLNNGQSLNYINSELQLTASIAAIDAKKEEYKDKFDFSNNRYQNLLQIQDALYKLFENIYPYVNFEELKSKVLESSTDFFNIKSGYYPLINNAQIKLQDVINYIEKYTNYLNTHGYEYIVDMLSDLRNYYTNFSTCKGLLSLLGGDYYLSSEEGINNFLNLFNSDYYIDLELQHRDYVIIGLMNLVDQYNYYLEQTYEVLGAEIYEELTPIINIRDFYEQITSRLQRFLMDSTNDYQPIAQWKTLMGINNHVEGNEEIYQYFEGVYNSLFKYISDVFGEDIYNNQASFIYNSFDVNSYINNILKPIDTIINLKLKPEIDILQSKINKLNIENTQNIDLYTYFLDLEENYEQYYNHKILVVKPIVMLYNTFGMSHIQEWDGNKIDMGDSYILAPQVGAGIKDNNNTFTGVIMGIEQSFNKEGSTIIDKHNNIGLLGYHQNAKTFFLNSRDGSAIFGKEGPGQIILDPSQSKAYIYSSNYWINYNKDGKPSSYEESNKTHHGMLINLTDAEIHLAETVEEGSPRGKIYSGTHTTLNSTAEGFYLDQSGLSIGSKVYIDANGVMKLGLNAVDGQGNNNWTINANTNNSFIAYGTSIFGGTAASGGTQNVYLGTDGISLGGSNFWVNNAGELHAKNAYIEGNSRIGGWEVVVEGNQSYLRSTNDGPQIILNGTTGIITATNLASTNNGGTIAGWKIQPGELRSDNSYINLRSTGVPAIYSKIDFIGELKMGWLLGDQSWYLAWNRTSENDEDGTPIRIYNGRYFPREIRPMGANNYFFDLDHPQIGYYELYPELAMYDHNIRTTELLLRDTSILFEGSIIREIDGESQPYWPTLTYTRGVAAARQFSIFTNYTDPDIGQQDYATYLVAGATGEMTEITTTGGETIYAYNPWDNDNDHTRRIITDLRYNIASGQYEYKYRTCHILKGLVVKWSDLSNWTSVDNSAPKVKYYHGDMEPGEYFIDFTLPDWATGMTNTILTVSPIKNGAVTFLKWEFVNNDSSTVRLHFSDFTSDTINWKIETFTNS